MPLGSNEKGYSVSDRPPRTRDPLEVQEGVAGVTGDESHVTLVTDGRCISQTIENLRMGVTSDPLDDAILSAGMTLRGDDNPAGRTLRGDYHPTGRIIMGG